MHYIAERRSGHLYTFVHIRARHLNTHYIIYYVIYVQMPCLDAQHRNSQTSGSKRTRVERMLLQAVAILFYVTSAVHHIRLVNC